jgi:hypothetical protein
MKIILGPRWSDVIIISANPVLQPSLLRDLCLAELGVSAIRLSFLFVARQVPQPISTKPSDTVPVKVLALGKEAV